MVREMKFLKLVTIAILLAGGAMPSAAREVDLLQFGHNLSIEETSASPTSDTKALEAISGRLREYFEGRPEGHANAPPAPLRSAYDISASQIAGSGRARWGLQTIGPACEDASYSPTWWLPRSVEARRAAYFSAIVNIACENGVPARLLDAVIARESGYNSRAISSAGAMGIMQIMPGTARALGLSRPYDPIANMRAGARYLRQQLERFGRVDLALAAYNAGPERRTLQQGTVPRIPETLNYVRAIMTDLARLAELDRPGSISVDRAQAAMSAVNASTYRTVEFMGYTGSR